MDKTTVNPVDSIYDKEFEKELQSLADRYRLNRIKIETTRGRQAYERSYENPQLHLTRNQVIAGRGSRYTVADIAPDETPDEAWRRADESMRKKLSEYNKQYQAKNRERLREINRMHQRKRRAEERERRQNVKRRMN